MFPDFLKPSPAAVVVAAGVLVLPLPGLQVSASAQSVVNSSVENSRTEEANRQTEPWAEMLIAAARSQIGETTIYDPSYVGLTYPMGDIPRERGVCTDVLIRAYRDAFKLDLQRLVHEDMKRSFSAYPKIWGLKKPDRNIDHRRVPNLQRYFSRKGFALEVTNNPANYLPGDVVTQMLPGNLPHVAIVSDQVAADGLTPLVIHNIGAGTKQENRLFAFEITGHYRMPTNMTSAQ